MSSNNPPEPIKPEEFRAMALAVNKIQESAKAMERAGLTQDALVILLHHRTRVAQRDIKFILNALSSFADTYLTADARKLLRGQDK